MHSTGSVVEFFGMPAAGKTYSARQLADMLRDEDIEVDSRTLYLDEMPRVARIAFKLRRIIPAILCHPRLCYSAVSFVQVCRLQPKDFATIVFNWLFVLGLVLQRRAKGEVLLIDQGIAQAIWSTLYRARTGQGRNYSACEEILRACCPGSLMILHKTASVETVRQRLNDREFGGSPLDTGRGGDEKKAWGVTGDVSEVLADQVATNKTLTYIQAEDVDDRALVTILSAIRSDLEIESHT